MPEDKSVINLSHARTDSYMICSTPRTGSTLLCELLESTGVAGRPESGRSIPEFPDLPHREVIVRPYRFFYRVVGKTVWVVAVWHGAQLPASPGH